MELLTADSQTKPCPACSKETRVDLFKTHEEKYFCETCFAEVIRECAMCRKNVWHEDAYQVEGRLICDSCRDEHYRCCDSCETWVLSPHARYSDLREAYFCEECFETSVTFCSDCGSEIDRGDSFRNGRLFYCEECHERMVDEGEYLQQHELSSRHFTRSRSKRKYGVEIETILSEGHEHLAIDELGYWSKQKDGSLGEMGMEFASPILQGDDGFEELERFTEKLMSDHYYVDKSCGLHVHIDGRDLTFHDIKKLLKIALTYESVIYAMLPNSRFSGSYSVPLTKFPKSRFRRRVQNEEGLKEFWYGRQGRFVNTKSKFHHSRYFGVNIHSWFFRRSIEFRYHSGTLNAAKITNFIMICQAFVDRARKADEFRFVRFETFSEQFESFARFLRLNAKVKSYVHDRIMKFHPEKFQAILQVNTNQ